MRDLIIHKVNISHYRLIELSKLADQIKPFYDWIEKIAKKATGSPNSLHEILMTCSKQQIKEIIEESYKNSLQEKPLLFDGIGRVYPHIKACFYFFAWIIRDAPQQRLSPLITKMRKADKISELVAQTDSLVELIFEYRGIVKSFEWLTVREIVIDRLEGSRRSIRGHKLEANVRTALITAIQHYYSIYGNYGSYEKVNIADKQIKIGRHTIDVSAEFVPKKNSHTVHLLIPIKTRETEGGGHSHIFTRDIISAIKDIKNTVKQYFVVVIIIAENWSISEIKTIQDEIDLIFHFNISPFKFIGFDEKSQVTLNKFIEKALSKYERK